MDLGSFKGDMFLILHLKSHIQSGFHFRYYITSFKISNIYIIFLGGGFKYFLFSPLLGEMIQFD